MLTPKKRRESVNIAVQSGYTKAGIARAIGTTGDNLAKILARDGSRSKFVEILDKWLLQNGFIEDLPYAPIKGMMNFKEKPGIDTDGLDTTLYLKDVGIAQMSVGAFLVRAIKDMRVAFDAGDAEGIKRAVELGEDGIKVYEDLNFLIAAIPDLKNWRRNEEE